MIGVQRREKGQRLGLLVAGTKKDVVLGGRLWSERDGLRFFVGIFLMAV